MNYDHGIYTLTYTTADGGVVRLYNLRALGVDTIIIAQRALGSCNFAKVPQTHNYSQLEIELKKVA